MKEQYRNRLQLLTQIALEFLSASSRSGGMSALGSFTPHFDVNRFSRHGSTAGRIKHAGEVRRIKKHKRYRAHMRSLRR